jgi:esterase/lipase superfamily enzyme
LVDFSRTTSTATSSSYSGKISLSPKDLPHGEKSCSEFLASAVQKAAKKRVLFYVHGYWTTFEYAVRRGIALAQNIEYPGLVVVWSWPSGGCAGCYLFDEESADWAQVHLETFIHSLNSIAPDLRMDVLAHSLGNRMVLYFLERMTGIKALFQSVVFAAPDVAQDKFQQALDRIGSLGGLETLYASDSDDALSVSSYLHSPHGQSIPRAGSGGQNILISRFIESVDVTLETVDENTGAGTGSGHSYIFDNSKVISDLKKAVVLGKHADDRGLQVRYLRNNKYWSIDP